MAKARVWKPTDAERIDWTHPYIQMGRKIPGYLVQELHQFADSTWEKKLSQNKNLVEYINRKPWIPIEHIGILCCATSEVEDEEDHRQTEENEA